MSENLVKYFAFGEMETIESAKSYALRLFIQIQIKHGEEVARKIFAGWGKPLSKTQRAEIKDWEILARYDQMSPWPNVQKLARELAEENKALPPDEQRGAGGIDENNMDEYIRRLRRDRKKGLADGTWQGPGCETRWSEYWTIDPDE